MGFIIYNSFFFSEATMTRKAAQQRQSLRPKVALDRESLPKEWTY